MPRQGLAVPGFVVKMALRMIRGTVAKTANFNVRDLCPINHADRTFIPALFIAGRGDDFIRPHHRYGLCFRPENIDLQLSEVCQYFRANVLREEVTRLRFVQAKIEYCMSYVASAVLMC